MIFFSSLLSPKAIDLARRSIESCLCTAAAGESPIVSSQGNTMSTCCPSSSPLIRSASRQSIGGRSEVSNGKCHPYKFLATARKNPKRAAPYSVNKGASSKKNAELPEPAFVSFNSFQRSKAPKASIQQPLPFVPTLMKFQSWPNYVSS